MKKRSLNQVTKTPNNYQKQKIISKSKQKLINSQNKDLQESDDSQDSEEILFNDQSSNKRIPQKSKNKLQFKESIQNDNILQDFFNRGNIEHQDAFDRQSSQSGSSIEDLNSMNIKFIESHNQMPRKSLDNKNDLIKEIDKQNHNERFEEIKESQLISQDLIKNNCLMQDLLLGKRIFTNILKVYPKNQSIQNAISFNQMMSKNLTPDYDQNYQVEVKSAIFSSFEYEDVLLEPLFERKIPTTVFEDKLKRTNPEIFIQDDSINSNKVNVHNYETVPYASYHSKVIFYEFDDRLRLIISSGNLTQYMWFKIQQVIWIQDFPRLKLSKQKSKSSKKEQEFQESLQSFITHLIPFNLRNNESIFRSKINLDDFDFQQASVDLVQSINGRLKTDKKYNYGLYRVQTLLKDSQPMDENVKIWIQASSIGRLWPKYLQFFYFCLTGNLISEDKVHRHFGFIYPTEQFCRKSYLGIHSCDCLHLKQSSWKQTGFPRSQFYRYEGRTKELDRNIAHSKLIIITKVKDLRNEENLQVQIDDNTVIIAGSHNISTNAWGKEEKNGEQFTLANWELSIFKGPEKGSKGLKQQWIDSLCFKFPPNKYQFGDIPYFGDMDYK